TSLMTSLSVVSTFNGFSRTPERSSSCRVADPQPPGPPHSAARTPGRARSASEARWPGLPGAVAITRLFAAIGTGVESIRPALATAAIVCFNRRRIGHDHSDSAATDETHTDMSCCGLASHLLPISLRLSHQPSVGGRLDDVGKVAGIVRQTTAASAPPARHAVGDTT